MDIGTAKPTAEELAQVPHHLIDILDPLQSYSAAEFVRDATQLIAAIRQRHAVPLLVGGTRLYFKALLDGLDDMPTANPAVAPAPGRRGRRHRLARHARPAGPGRAGHRRPPGPQRQPRIQRAWKCGSAPASLCRLFINQKPEL